MLLGCGGGAEPDVPELTGPFSQFAGEYRMKLSGASSMTPECASNAQCHRGTIRMTVDADGTVTAVVAYETVEPFRGGQGHFIGHLNQDGHVDVQSAAYSGPAECEPRPEGAAFLRLHLHADDLAKSTGAWASPGFVPKAAPESLSAYCMGEVGAYSALGPIQFVSAPAQ